MAPALDPTIACDFAGRSNCAMTIVLNLPASSFKTDHLIEWKNDLFERVT